MALIHYLKLWMTLLHFISLKVYYIVVLVSLTASYSMKVFEYKKLNILFSKQRNVSATFWGGTGAQPLLFFKSNIVGKGPVSFQPYIGRVFGNKNNWFQPHIEEEKGTERKCSLATLIHFLSKPVQCIRRYRNKYVTSASVDTPRTSNHSQLALGAAFIASSSDVWASQSGVLEAAKSGDTTCTLSGHQFHLSILSPATLPLIGLTVRHWSGCESIVDWQVATLESGYIQHLKMFAWVHTKHGTEGPFGTNGTCHRGTCQAKSSISTQIKEAV